MSYTLISPDEQAFIERHNPDDLTPAYMAAALSEYLHLRLGEDGRLWRYDPAGVYRPDGAAHVEDLARRMLGARATARRVSAVVDYLALGRPTLNLDATADREYLNLHNGMLRWADLRLVPHSPDLPSIVQVPHDWLPGRPDWDPAAPLCPRILDFFRWLANGRQDFEEYMLTWAGACLYPGNPLQAWLAIYGTGQNGKLVVAKLLTALVGKENTTAESMQDLANSRFSASGLVGKLLNIDGDLDTKEITSSGTLKKITGGDAISVERKYHAPFSTVIPATLVALCNQPPTTRDVSKGYMRRLHLLPLDRTVPDAGRNPRLAEELTSDEQEMAGLLYLAVMAFKDAHAGGEIKRPGFVQEAVDRFEENANPVAAFIVERCIYDDVNARTPRAALYEAFRPWADDNGYRGRSAATFYEELRAQGYEEVKYQGVRCFRGIRLNKNIPFEARTSGEIQRAAAARPTPSWRRNV